ncbi:MAG: hypothetical protein V3U17_03090 [Thermoplasmata archaeon]
MLTSHQTSEIEALATGTKLTDRLRGNLDFPHRHIAFLKAVEVRQPIGIMRLSKLPSVPQHKVRYALRVLGHDGPIRPSQQGAVATKKTKQFPSELRVFWTR